MAGMRKIVGGGISAVVSGLILIGALSETDASTGNQVPENVVSAVSEQASAGVSTVPTSPETTPTASPAATAAKQPMPTATSQPKASGSATAAVKELDVKGRAPKTGYVRAQFGSGWIDVNRNGCDTRNDMLKAHLTERTMSGSCKVLSGTLADPYTGRDIYFVYGGASEVDIDHVVALSDAWQKGAQKWSFEKRVAFANDPLNLQPADAGANRSKGDGDAATWLPPNKAYRCEYIADQAAVKTKYGLWVTAAEREAMLRVLGSCPNQGLTDFGSQPTTASNTGGQKAAGQTPSRAEAPKPTQNSSAAESSGKLDPQFRTCGLANAAGYGPYFQGTDAEYDWYQDRDKDGGVCER